MTEKIPLRIDSHVAAVNFLRRFKEATEKDNEQLQQLFYWFQEQGKESVMAQEKAGPAKVATLE